MPLCLLALCLAFGRGPWLALAGAPLAYNAMLNMGLLNYLIGLPLMFLSVAAARWWIDRRGLGGGLLLGGLLVLTFFGHLLAAAMAVSFVAALFVLHHDERRDWLRFTSLAGVAWLFAASYLTANESLGPAVFWYEPMHERLASLHANWLRFFRNDSTDEVVAALLVVLWIASMALGPRGDTNPPKAALRDRLRLHDYRVLTACATIGWLILPSHSVEVHVINHRVICVIPMFLALWPTYPTDGVVPDAFRCRSPRVWKAFGAALAVIALAYPIHAAREFIVFEREVVGDLPAAIARLAPGTMLGYSSEVPTNPVTHMGPTWHIPAGIHAVENGGVTNDSFATRPTTVIQYAEPAARPPPAIREFWRGEQLSRMDYALWRGAEPRSEALRSRTRLIFQQGLWWLYEVRPIDEWPDVELSVGHPQLVGSASLDCDGEPPSGLRVHEERGLVHGVALLCSTGGTSTIGSETEHPTELRCPEGSVLRGVHGRVGDLVDAIGPLCARPSTLPRPAGVVGGAGGSPFTHVCPDALVVTGVTGQLSGDRAGLTWRCSRAARPEPG